MTRHLLGLLRGRRYGEAAKGARLLVSEFGAFRAAGLLLSRWQGAFETPAQAAARDDRTFRSGAFSGSKSRLSALVISPTSPIP